MMVSNAEVRSVGALIRSWRERRRLSQLDLAGDAEISARHLSFIETNRSRPSRDVLARLSERLEVPLVDRNALLLAAGYAPVYRATPLDAPTMEPIRAILVVMLESRLPTVIVTRQWDLVDVNAAARIFMEGVAEHLLAPPANALRMALHPDGMASRIKNFEQWRDHALGRLRREMRFTGDPRLRELYDELSALGAARAPLDERAPELAVPLRFEHRGEELEFINTVATFGTPVDVTISELMIETFHPLNAAAKRWIAST